MKTLEFYGVVEWWRKQLNVSTRKESFAYEYVGIRYSMCVTGDLNLYCYDSEKEESGKDMGLIISLKLVLLKDKTVLILV